MLVFSHSRCFFFFQAEDGIRDDLVTGVQTCALPIWIHRSIAGTSAPFRVTYQAYQDGDEPAPAAERSFHHLQDVRTFLNVLGLAADYVRDAFREFTSALSAFFTNITFTENPIKNSRFVSL